MLVRLCSLLCIPLSLSALNADHVSTTFERAYTQVTSNAKRWYSYCSELCQPSILRDEPLVYHFLTQLGWRDISFTSVDGVELHGMIRPPVGECTGIVVVSGGMSFAFERLAPFHNIIHDEHIAVLLYHPRGIAKSQGSLVGKHLCAYGSYGHCDVLGALKTIHDKHPHAPVFLVGICAGGFHTMRALCELTPEQCAQYHIQGVLIDSSFYTTQTVSQTVLSGYFQERMRYTCMRTTAAFIGSCITQFIIRPLFYDTCVNPETYAQRNIPTIFLHGAGDRMARWCDMHPFIDALSARGAPVSYHVFEHEQRHALNHIKHPHDYQHFLNQLYTGLIRAGCDRAMQ